MTHSQSSLPKWILIVSGLAMTFCAFLMAPKSYACDPLGCILGSDSPTIGQVISQAEDSIEIKIISAFPGNKVKTQEGAQITIKDFTTKLTLGKKYLMPLEKIDDNFYIPRSYAIFEVTGSSYLDAKLVKNNSIDDQALQIFINSGGAEKDFDYDYSGDEPVLLVNGQKIESELHEKNISWHETLSGILFFLASWY